MKPGLTNFVAGGIAVVGISSGYTHPSYAGGITSSTTKRSTEREYLPNHVRNIPAPYTAKEIIGKYIGRMPFHTGDLFELMGKTAEWKRKQLHSCGGAIDSCIIRNNNK